MIEKASIYTMNALNKSSELWHTSVNRKARPVVEGEHDKSWNDHALTYQISVKQILLIFQKMFNCLGVAQWSGWSNTVQKIAAPSK